MLVSFGTRFSTTGISLPRGISAKYLLIQFLVSCVLKSPAIVKVTLLGTYQRL